jgi:hypothetical protein
MHYFEYHFRFQVLEKEKLWSSLRLVMKVVSYGLGAYERVGRGGTDIGGVLKV